jgi:phage-related protein
MRWEILYYNKKLEEDILSLPKTLVAKYFHYTEIMERLGADLGMPHTKLLGNGLLELRLKGKEGIARVFYMTQVGKKIMMLHCVIKKTPLQALKVARNRLKEVLRS